MSSIKDEARAVLAAAHEALGPSDRERQRAQQRFAAALGVVPVGIGLGWSGGAGLAAEAAGQGGAAAAVAGSATMAGASTAATAAATVGSAAAGTSTAVTTAGTLGVVAGKWMAGGFLAATSAAGAIYTTEALQDPAPPAEVRPAATPTRSTPNTRAAMVHRALEPGPAPADETPADMGKLPVGRLPDTVPLDRRATSAVGRRALGEELALVRQVDAVLRAGRPDSALEMLRGGDNRFGRGELGEERQALEIVALCTLDPSAGASRAAAFLASHPRSVYARRLRDACRLGVSRRWAPAPARRRTEPEAADTLNSEPSARKRFGDIESP